MKELRHIRAKEKGVTIQKQNLVPKSQNHVYNQPTYEWSKDNSQCTAKEVCSLCGNENTEVAKSKINIIEEATCSENGKRAIYC
ncbi:MAG: hypothetical protein ACLS61_16970 [Ruminococcus sp.]